MMIEVKMMAETVMTKRPINMVAKVLLYYTVLGYGLVNGDTQ